MKLLKELEPGFSDILTADCLNFIAELERNFGQKRKELLRQRELTQLSINKRVFPEFKEDPGNWTINPPPRDLQKRWVEITGPAGDRKMVINAFNSGADVYMADFEDSQSPTWSGLINGQINLRDAVNRVISFNHPQKGLIKLNEKPATLMVRPRGWHLLEKHILVDDHPISASIFDFGLFICHNGLNLINNGSGPYFYLPKLENAEEARTWNDIFSFTEKGLGMKDGAIKATVLIESILSVFEADLILKELAAHSVGLNVGRWDYIASFGKKFRNHREFVFPDRGLVTMTTHCMKSYVDYVIRVCHKRGVHAIGGMAAQIPINNDLATNKQALDKVRADKEREVRAGHDGTWVAHPGLVKIAREVFENYLGNKPNQIDKKRGDVTVSPSDILLVPNGPVTEEGLREDIIAFVKYVACWLNGTGAVAIDYMDKNNNLYAYLMEDAATAEIARTQVWKWIRERIKLQDGRTITPELVWNMLEEELAKMKESPGDTVPLYYYNVAASLFFRLITSDHFADYLTLPAYDILVDTLEY